MFIDVQLINNTSIFSLFPTPPILSRDRVSLHSPGYPETHFADVVLASDSEIYLLCLPSARSKEILNMPLYLTMD